MNGQNLKAKIKASLIKVEDIVAGSGIPKRTLLSLYHKNHVEYEYVEKLKKVIPDLDELPMPAPGEGRLYKMIIDQKDETINVLQKLVSSYEEQITAYKKTRELTSVRRG